MNTTLIIGLVVALVAAYMYYRKTAKVLRGTMLRELSGPSATLLQTKLNLKLIQTEAGAAWPNLTKEQFDSIPLAPFQEFSAADVDQLIADAGKYTYEGDSKAAVSFRGQIVTAVGLSNVWLFVEPPKMVLKYPESKKTN
jgi:hypothetical protein